uniref:flavin monoamine oxidase family protein n=1 Tax=uncultured Sphingomonas sp. TaxID=158754 RepID=UPI0035C975C4
MADYKIVIIGAGVSGLYAAWRLTVDTQTYHPDEVLVLEASDRTGGRLRTWTLNDIDPVLPDDPTVRAELGGMRVINYDIYVCSLVTHFGLSMVPFPADVPQNWHYFRSQTVQSEEYPRQDIFHLAPSELYWTPGDVLYNSLVKTGVVPQDIFPTADGSITLRDFVDSAIRTVVVDGVPAWKLGFWNAIVGSGAALNPSDHVVSQESYAYFTQTGAYDTVPSNWNAAIAFPISLVDFSNAPTYWAITDGYERLPDRLAHELAGASVEIRKQRPVTGLFYDAAAATYAVEIGDTLISAERVALAIPPHAVDTLAGNAVLPSAGLSAPLAALLPQIRQAAPIPLLKVYLVYDQDWWSAAIPDWPAFTRMTTDMPMRQTYNFGAATGADGKTYYLFQSVYCDALNAGYWAGLMPQEGENKGIDLDTDIFARIQNLTQSTIETGTLRFGTQDKVADFPMFLTSHQQFETMVRSVAAGTSISPVEPIAGVAMNWGVDPFGGGVNYWNVGVNLDDGAGGGAYWEMLNPLENLYIIGEGYSLQQCWVEGALWSAEDMLQRHFGLSIPTWLDRVPYRGAGGNVPAVAAAQGQTVRAAMAVEA